MYKIQLIHLHSSTFIECLDQPNRELVEQEAELLYLKNKQMGLAVLWLGLWQDNQVIDTYDGQSWGREYEF